MRHRAWIVPLALVALLAAAHFAYWRYLVNGLQDGFAAFVSARRAAGWTVRASGLEDGGWPLSATLRVRGLTLEGGDPDLPGGLAWGTQMLDLRVDLLSPALLHLAAGGAQHLRLGALPDIAYTAREMTATMPLSADGLPGAAHATLRDLTAAPAAGAPRGPVTMGLLQADATMDWAAPRDRPAISAQIAAEAIGLPPGMEWPLGNRISSASVEAAIGGPLPSPGPLARTAAAWRDGGGVLRIHRMALGWGPLGLSGSGTLMLDPGLQPAGSMQLRAVGFAAALDALSAGKAVAPGAATAAKAVLSLLAAPPEPGAPPVADVPLAIQDGVLSLRQLPVARVPPIAWPVGPRRAAAGG
ncbi:MAG: DUF2125 domain-containing protein [Proteobacteria bacterium]|nr:DUF2125 domain-containing protein [Pseudomonadota bacterium]